VKPPFDAQRAILALNPGTSSAPAASGIGIQINRLFSESSSPQPFGKIYSDAATTTNGSGNFLIPFQASYIQIAPTMTPGIANSIMMVTVWYQ
jgi:type 1 fimbria pilin